jgi:hypothetical protein
VQVRLNIFHLYFIFLVVYNTSCIYRVIGGNCIVHIPHNKRVPRFSDFKSMSIAPIENNKSQAFLANFWRYLKRSLSRLNLYTLWLYVNNLDQPLQGRFITILVYTPQINDPLFIPMGFWERVTWSSNRILQQNITT